MNRSLLATAFTPDYERGYRYMDTVRRHADIPFIGLTVGDSYGVPDFGMPRSILQAGHFLDFIPPCETIIFTDADVLMHRPIDPDEMEFINGIEEGQISACYNHHGEELFAEEAKALGQRHPLDGFEDVRVFNTGFLIARMTTYRMMFARFQQLWPAFDAAFDHYAKVQLAICAAAHQLGIEWKVTPGHLCTHGHFGWPPGCDRGREGMPPTFNGRVICFDHRLTH